MKFLLNIVIFSFIFIMTSAKMDRILFNKYPEAQCLDGSPSGIYWQAGYGSGEN